MTTPSYLRVLAALTEALPRANPYALETALNAGIKLALGEMHRHADAATRDNLAGPIGDALHAAAFGLEALLDEKSQERLTAVGEEWWKDEAP